MTIHNVCSIVYSHKWYVNWCLQRRHWEMGSYRSADQGLYQLLERLIFTWHSTLCTRQYSSAWKPHRTSHSWLQCYGKSVYHLVSRVFTARCLVMWCDCSSLHMVDTLPMNLIWATRKTVHFSAGLVFHSDYIKSFAVVIIKAVRNMQLLKFVIRAWH